MGDSKRVHSGPSRDPESKRILARSLYNQLSSQHWSRADIIDFVNVFLDVVINTENVSTGGPMVDEETGFPTRAGFQELVRHELDPSRTRKTTAVLSLVRAHGVDASPILAERLRHDLRRNDVVSPLGRGLIGVVLYIRSEHVAVVMERIRARIAPAACAYRVLQPDLNLKLTWKALLTELAADRARTDSEAVPAERRREPEQT